MTAYLGILLTTCSFLLVGCTSLPPGGPKYGGDKTSDVAKPKNSTVNYAQSIILGPESAWVGRLVYTCSNDPAYMWDFLQSEMSRLGWIYISGMRSGTSVMIFKKASRVANLQIKERLIYGSTVICDIGPESTEMAPASELMMSPEANLQMPPQTSSEYGPFTP